MNEKESISKIRVDEYHLSLNRIKKVSSKLTIAFILLFLIIAYSLIISELAHLLWLEMLLAVIDIVWIVTLIIQVRQEKKYLKFDQLQLDIDDLALIKLDIYHYHKQLNDTLFYAIFVFMSTIYLILSFIKISGELSGAISYQFAIFAAVLIAFLLYMLIKTILVLYCGIPYIGNKQQTIIKKRLITTSVKCFIYWLIVYVFLLLDVIAHHHSQLVNIIFAIVYFFIGIISNLSNKQINLSSLHKKTILINCIVVFILSVFGFMYIEFDLLNTVVSEYKNVDYVSDYIEYDDGTYVIKTNKDDFKVLQLSDIHLGASLISNDKDKKAIEACYRLIEDTKPDLIVVSGDLVFSVGIKTLSFNNYTSVRSFCDFMNNIGIPWVFTYGNHDTEFLSTASKKEIDELYLSKSFINGSKLLYPDIKPNISGRCNQYIEIRNDDNSLRQVLFLIDSNACRGLRANVYEGIHVDQVKWYEDTINDLNDKENSVVKSIIYTHVPIYQTKFANNNLQDNKTKLISGFLPSDIFLRPITSQRDDCGLFASVKKLNSTKAIFYGHNHFTTINMMYDDIQLCYGLSIDYITSSKCDSETYQRGGTIVTLYKDTTYSVDQRLLIDILEGR